MLLCILVLQLPHSLTEQYAVNIQIVVTVIFRGVKPLTLADLLLSGVGTYMIILYVIKLFVLTVYGAGRLLSKLLTTLSYVIICHKFFDLPYVQKTCLMSV